LSLAPEHSALVNTFVRFVDRACKPLGDDPYFRSDPSGVPPLRLDHSAEVFVEIGNWTDNDGYFQVCLTLTRAAAE